MTPTIWTPSPAQAFRASVLLRDGKRCALEASGECRGDLEAHHIVPRSVLRVELRGAPYWAKDNAVSDDRNGMMLCEFHHQRAYLVEPSDVPDWPGLEDFATQYGVPGRLPGRFARMRVRS